MRKYFLFPLLFFCFIFHSHLSCADDSANLLKSKWMSMTERLKNGNIEDAIQHIHPHKRAVYRQAFDNLQTKLPQIASTEIDFKVVELAEKYARFELITNEDGRTYSYEVLFVKDDDGNWYIYNF